MRNTVFEGQRRAAAPHRYAWRKDYFEIDGQRYAAYWVDMPDGQDHIYVRKLGLGREPTAQPSSTGRHHGEMLSFKRSTSHALGQTAAHLCPVCRMTRATLVAGYQNQLETFGVAWDPTIVF